MLCAIVYVGLPDREAGGSHSAAPPRLRRPLTAQPLDGAFGFLCWYFDRRDQPPGCAVCSTRICELPNAGVFRDFVVFVVWLRLAIVFVFELLGCRLLGGVFLWLSQLGILPYNV